MTTIETDRDATMRELLRDGWTPALFAAFWAAPDPKWLPPMCAPNIVGHWPGATEPVRGPEVYVAVLEQLITALPDIRLEMPDHAMNGDVGFVRWVMHATGKHGPFQLDGVDCLHVRDGLVVQNFINFDNTAFLQRSGLG